MSGRSEPPRGDLAWAGFPDGSVDFRMPDAIGNLFGRWQWRTSFGIEHTIERSVTGLPAIHHRATSRRSAVCTRDRRSSAAPPTISMMAIAQKLGLGALKKFRARKDPNRQIIFHEVP
jgi:hypothetical protein